MHRDTDCLHHHSRPPKRFRQFRVRCDFIHTARTPEVASAEIVVNGADELGCQSDSKED